MKTMRMEDNPRAQHKKKKNILDAGDRNGLVELIQALSLLLFCQLQGLVSPISQPNLHNKFWQLCKCTLMLICSNLILHVK